MSVFFFDEPFEGDRVPTADDLRRATPLPGVTSWMEWSADPEPAPVSEWLQPGGRVEVHEVGDGFLVLPAALDDEDTRAKAEIERQTRPTPDPLLASGGPVSPVADITAAMQRLDLHLTPWQQRVADAVLNGDARRLAFTYPKQSGRRSISRVVAAAMNGAPVPLSREMSLVLTANVSGFASAIRAAAEAAEKAARAFARYEVEWWTLDEPLTVRAKRARRRAIEQRRIRQAMRHIERRAARRQRRAASRAARAAR